MAGARRKPNKKNGNYQGYYRDYTGRRVFFVGTPSRQETKQIAQQLEAEHRQIVLGTKPPPTAPARHRRRPFLEVVDEYVSWGKAFGRSDGKGWTARWAGDVDGCLHKWANTLSIEVLADVSVLEDEPQLKKLRERVLQRDSDEAFYDCGCKSIRDEYHDGTVAMKVIRHDGHILIDELEGGS